MVNLALTGPPQEVGTDGWSLPQSSSPTATLSFMAEDHLRKRGPGRGGVAEPKTDTNTRAHRHTLPTQARMQIPSPSQNASVGIICEQKSSRRAVSASLLSLLAPPAWRQPGESPSYLFAASAEANGSTMDPIGQGQAWLSFSPPYHQPFSPPPSPGPQSAQ